MLKKLISTTTVICCTLFLVISSAYSEDKITKDNWLKQFKNMAPGAMCNSLLTGKVTADTLKTKQINYEKCTSLITQSVDRCLAQYSSTLPQEINSETSKKWGLEIGKCSGRDFYQHNIAK